MRNKKDYFFEESFMITSSPLRVEKFVSHLLWITAFSKLVKSKLINMMEIDN